MSATRAEVDLLLRAGRMLLEYNDSTEAIQQALVTTANSLVNATCHVAVYYSGVAVAFAEQLPKLSPPVRELRYNAAIQTAIHALLDRVRQHLISVDEAMLELDRIETTTPRHHRLVSISVLGLAAASLACLLGADLAAILTVALSTALGLAARQELGRRHYPLLTLPLVAAFIGTFIGGTVIRWQWTTSYELILIVPALMLVPGPHLINSIIDLVDNHLTMSLSRLGLASGILLASGLGGLCGIELTLSDPTLKGHEGAGVVHIGLFSDMLLAAVVTAGFAVFYNTPWKQVTWTVVGGMVGHGLRFLCLQSGHTLEVSTFLGSLAVGAVASWMSKTKSTPFAVMAFAGAVTMMPGLTIYRILGGGVQLAHGKVDVAADLTTRVLGNFFETGMVVGGLALGLILGKSVVATLLKDGRDHLIKQAVSLDATD